MCLLRALLFFVKGTSMGKSTSLYEYVKLVSRPRPHVGQHDLSGPREIPSLNALELYLCRNQHMGDFSERGMDPGCSVDIQSVIRYNS